MPKTAAILALAVSTTIAAAAIIACAPEPEPTATQMPPTPTSTPRPSATPEPTAMPTPTPTAAEQLPQIGSERTYELRNTQQWLNGDPTTIANLREAGKVVLIDFWTYT